MNFKGEIIPNGGTPCKDCGRLVWLPLNSKTKECRCSKCSSGNVWHIDRW